VLVVSDVMVVYLNLSLMLMNLLLALASSCVTSEVQAKSVRYQIKCAAGDYTLNTSATSADVLVFDASPCTYHNVLMYGKDQVISVYFSG